jgi:hypothetical protein
MARFVSPTNLMTASTPSNVLAILQQRGKVDFGSDSESSLSESEDSSVERTPVANPLSLPTMATNPVIALLNRGGIVPRFSSSASSSSFSEEVEAVEPIRDQEDVVPLKVKKTTPGIEVLTLSASSLIKASPPPLNMSPIRVSKPTIIASGK